MAKRIPKAFIDELIGRTDIVDLIGTKISYAKKTGDNHMACCPFHNEKTPSFSVSESKQFYYCFGCQASGDALRFLMEYDHLTFVEAVESLAAYNGMTVPYEEDGQTFDATEKVRLEQGLACLEAATRFYQQCFYEQDGQAAREYLRHRAVKKSTIERYRIGYAPAGNRLLETLADSYSLALIQAVGLAGEKEENRYDWFRDRVMFPIRNMRGQVIGFGARAMGDGQPKYLNSPESDWFNKRRELYGLDLAVHSRARSLIVAEGYMDVVKMAQFGLDNAIACLGTAFGEAHLAQLRKRAKKISFCFDGDEAGLKAAEKALKILFAQYEETHDWRFVFLPSGEDPDSLLTRHGREAFDRCLDASLTPSQFLEKILQIEESGNWPVERQARAARSAAQWLGLLPRGNYRSFLQRQLQNRLAAPVEIVREVPEPRNSHAERAKRTPRAYASGPEKLEWRLAAILQAHPDWHVHLEGTEVERIIAERMPVFHELCYLARCGADRAVLRAALQDAGLEKEISRAASLIDAMEEVDLEKELADAINRQLAHFHEKRSRLEKLGG